jgi:hypothetical protein
LMIFRQSFWTFVWMVICFLDYFLMLFWIGHFTKMFNSARFRT